MSDGNYKDAKKQISELQNVFPDSKEVQLSIEIEPLIQKKEALIDVEKERIKSAGYKAFNDNTSFQIGDVSCVMSGFNYGMKYVFGSCLDTGEYSYSNADKDDTFLLMSLSMSTKEKYASVPDFGFYIVKEGNLVKIGRIRKEYATWSSYGAKIGNNEDDSHNFSKVNTINYKLACEISQNELKRPMLLLVKKDGANLKGS